MQPADLLEHIHAGEDEHFDLLYPPKIRVVSSIHWTPVKIASQAAEFLVREPGTRVLDIGCGPGKFCIVGALTTPGRFTGVEQRQWLCDLARTTVARTEVPNVEFVHGNIEALPFSGFDAFYLFNPFEENLETSLKIDETVHLDGELYERYTEHVGRQLALAPVGTRVATYCGACEEVPTGYECLETSIDYRLKFWEKTKHHPPRTKVSETAATNNRWRFMSDLVHYRGFQ